MTRSLREHGIANAASRSIILASAAVGTALYLILAGFGDPRAFPVRFLLIWALLIGLSVIGWRVVRHDAQLLRVALGAALLFRLVAAFGPPTLSDDVYRYVWDGRVQLAGVHPFRYAPDDPALEDLRDANHARINHPELRTIYPPLAQMVFLSLAATGSGPTGFKLAFGLADFGVVLLLLLLLRRLGLPQDRVVLYAWSPLAILETAGSGHVEPIGVALVLCALLWLRGKRPGRATTALGAAIQIKLLPLVLVPGILRRVRAGWWVWLAVVMTLIWLPYALTGPRVGAGLFAYAERWEHNALAFSVVRELLEWIDCGPPLKALVAGLQQRIGDWPIPWEFLYRHLWPAQVARGVVALAALAWTAVVVLRAGQGAVREGYLVLAGVLLLSPTLHPWYVLWVLPFAVAWLSPGWLVLGATVVLNYLAPPGGDVPWLLRLAEYLPALGAAILLRPGPDRSPLG